MTCRLALDNGTYLPAQMTVISASDLPNMQEPMSGEALASIKTSPRLLPHPMSMPATPAQRPYFHSDSRRSPSPHQISQNPSPRSTHSDPHQSATNMRRVQGGCRFETGMMKACRRIPYSMGPEKLERAPSELQKNQLSIESEKRISGDIERLYEQLLPSPEGEERRTQFVQKLEHILRVKWPENSIKVNVFGSTGNNLGTSDSDVDICITTDCKQMERVCSIAELLAKNGMEKVVCVSSARVPIVKVWDPELQVACDINVNNPLALENTALIRSYVTIDPRVRPLAMIVKHWAKRRMLNDAALGGTLSSYTWICLTLNFLQTRRPPILPTLQKPNLEPHVLNGVNVAFDKDISSYTSYGTSNKTPLGELLFQFFRYYGHEIDFESSAFSVRLGKVIPKIEKSWHLLQDNRLCVEEPFNISRNLANTADDTSMRGIHLEIRRAFNLIAEGKLEECCEQYVAPPQEESRSAEFFVPPTAKPVLKPPPAQPSRGGRTNVRGGKHSNNYTRTPGARRSSAPFNARSPMFLRNLPFSMTPQELQAQAQHQQHLLHDHLYQQFQYLQAQEQALRLRMQMHQQTMRDGSLSHQDLPRSAFGTYDHRAESQSESSSLRNYPTPMSAPLHQQQFAGSSPLLSSGSLSQGIITNPNSPHLAPAFPELQRYSRRATSMHPATNGSLRAHSQPARGILPNMVYSHLRPGVEMRPAVNGYTNGRKSSNDSSSGDAPLPNGVPSTLRDAARRPAEYVGYYVGPSPSLSAQSRSTAISPLPFHAGLAIRNGGLSPRLSSPTSKVGSAHESPSANYSTLSSAIENGVSRLSLSQTLDDQLEQQDALKSPKVRSGPLVVDGSLNSPLRRRKVQETPSRRAESSPSSSSASDSGLDTPSSSNDHISGTAQLNTPAFPAQSTPQRPVLAEKGNSGPEAVTEGKVETSSSIQEPNKMKPALNGIKGERLHSLASPRSMTFARSMKEQLSPVHEVPSPFSLLEQDEHKPEKDDGSEAEKRAQVVEPTSATLGAQRAVQQTAVPTKEQPSVSTTAPPASTTTQPSGWQTQKRRRKPKKNPQSENEAEVANPAGGETLPSDESLRKGG